MTLRTSRWGTVRGSERMGRCREPPQTVLGQAQPCTTTLCLPSLHPRTHPATARLRPLSPGIRQDAPGSELPPGSLRATRRPLDSPKEGMFWNSTVPSGTSSASGGLRPDSPEPGRRPQPVPTTPASLRAWQSTWTHVDSEKQKCPARVMSRATQDAPPLQKPPQGSPHPSGPRS